MTSPRARTAALAGIGSLLIVLTAWSVSLDVAHDPTGSAGVFRNFIAVTCAAGGLYLIAVVVVLRNGLSRHALPVILLGAVLMRLLVLPGPPVLSDDLYRYIWDGRVQGAGINPYRYIPAAPELEPLRDTDIYPRINRANYAVTIYPPFAQAIFLAIAKVSQTVLAVKVTMVLFEAVAMVALLKLLDGARLPRERILLYAWNPLTVWEFAGNGHIDAATIAFLALALLAYAHRRSSLTGAAVAAAVLTKLLPLAVLPALWRRFDLRMPAVFGAVVGLSYLAYSGAGWHVFGFLPGYVAEEGLATGQGIYYFWALQQLGAPLSFGLYVAAAGACLVALGCWVAFFRRRDSGLEALDAAKGALILATALMLAVTPHYAWYLAWLAFFACLAPSYSVLAMTVLAPTLYLDQNVGGFLWTGLVYGLFPVLALLEFWWHRQTAPHAISTIEERPAA